MASRKKPTKAEREAQRKREEKNEQRRIAYAKKKKAEAREAKRLEKERLARNAKRRADYAAKRAETPKATSKTLVETPKRVKAPKPFKEPIVKAQIPKKEKRPALVVNAPKAVLEAPKALPPAAPLEVAKAQEEPKPLTKKERNKARRERNERVRARNADIAARRAAKAAAKEKARQEKVLKEREDAILKMTPDQVADVLTDWEDAPFFPKPESLDELLRDANKAAERKGLSDVWFEDGRIRAEDDNGREWYGYMITNTETGNQRVMFSQLGEMGFHTPKSFGEKYDDTTDGFEFAFEWEDMFYGVDVE